MFLQALEQPQAERSAFLERTCSDDPELRREVESLLASDAAAESFCETPAAGLLEEELALAAPPRLQTGVRLGAYEIVEFIAAGGMGEVYRARHVVLERDVAIKIIGSQLTDESAHRRLIREARNASTLSHPNICTIYEVGESADGPFIVMEYLRGRLLSEVLEESALDLDQALDYGIQIADALEHAHQHGIIHRDLKSSNIIVAAERGAVVLDFGVARRLPQSTDAPGREPTLTATHALAGTLSHMAPEVLLGGASDARSDVWALGVLLYQLATGDLPFKGRTAYETSSVILGELPRRISNRVPFALRLVIERCLMKDPDARYQRASDVRAALDAIKRKRAWPLVGGLLVSLRRRTLRTSAALLVLLPVLFLGGVRLAQELTKSGPRTIAAMALLPFHNPSGDAETQYYADGLTDAVIAQLGELTETRIISRTSAARAAAGADAPADIARQLSADVVVDGIVRRAQGQVEVELRLIAPTSGRVLWSDTYERSTTDVLALHADVAQALALAARLVMRPEARERLSVVRAVSPNAYEEYLKGRYHWNQRTTVSLRRAVAHLTRAVELDPTYAPAHAALADCFNQLGTVLVGSGSPREFRPRAAAAAIKALQIDPNSAEAHATLGYVRHYQWKWVEAERELKRAIELNPSYSLARMWYANLLMSLGRMNEAVQQVFAARELDPFSLVVNTNVGWVLQFAGRHAEAITHLQHVVALDSTYVQARIRLAHSLAATGRLSEAEAQANRVVALTKRAAPSVGLLAALKARTGQHAEARVLIDELLARSRREYVPPWTIASTLLALRDVEQAVPWMEKTFEEGSNAIAYFNADPSLRSLRDDPRFRSLLVRAGFDVGR